MTLHVKEALNRVSREAIFRFRYQFMNHHDKNVSLCVDHRREMICDHIDNTARLFYVEDAGVICGTARVNFSQAGGWPLALTEHSEISLVESVMLAERVSLTSHLVLHPGAQRQKVLVSLITKIYEVCLQRDVLVNLLSCDFGETVNYFLLGYRLLRNVIQGQPSSLVLCVQDFDYLQHMESPLFGLVGKRIGDGGETAFLLEGCCQAFAQDRQDDLNRRVSEKREQKINVDDEVTRMSQQQCVNAY